VGESIAHAADPNGVLLDALAKVAALFPWPMPRVRDLALCFEIAHCIDTVLSPIARGRAAVDVAIGDGLDGLSQGNLVLKLGSASVAEYAREWLGLNASTAQKMARFARKLRERPHLRAAVWAGEVSPRRAEAVMPVAIGYAEPHWVARAKLDTVRALKAQVKAPASQDPDEDEPWVSFSVDLPSEVQPRLQKAMELAGDQLAANATRQHRFEAMCQEYYGAYGQPEDERAADALAPLPTEAEIEPVKEWLEEQAQQWRFLSQPNPITAPWTDPDAQRDPWLRHDELRRRMSMRTGWDQVFGHMAMLFKKVKGWYFLGFASFEHYCEERLGMSLRAVQQRVRLEQRLYRLPSLRQALCQRRISYEKARLIARYADEAAVDGWIERAARTSCVRLRRALEGEEEAQMCARGNFSLSMPLRIRGLAAMAIRAARRQAGRSISPGECLGMIADHCIEVWEKASPRKNTAANSVRKRDHELCQVPGCSRAGEHEHHVVFRSAGGGNGKTNKILLCSTHHLQCIHNGWVRVTGEAPDKLRWQLGVRSGRPPLLDVLTMPDGSYLAARRDWPDSFPPPGVEAATTGRASEDASSLS